MTMQSPAEKQNISNGTNNGAEWSSSRFAQGLFLFIGFLVTLSAFFILQSFIKDLIADERVRMSQDLAEQTVEDFKSLYEPVDALAALISLSGPQDYKRIASSFSVIEQNYQHFSQILLFYQNDEQKWVFAELFKHKQQDLFVEKINVTPNAHMLSQLLQEGNLNSEGIRLIDNLEGLSGFRERVKPQIMAGPFAMARAVDAQNPEKGILLAVVNPLQIFDEKWLSGHRAVDMIRVRNVKDNRDILVIDRTPDTRAENMADMQIYEFPFAGQKWEISSVLLSDQKTLFLKFFPYVVMVFGLVLVAIGAFYIRINQKQAGAMRQVNEKLAQKNFELESENAERERLNKALRDSERKNRAVIDTVGDIIFEADRDGRIVFLNKAWQKLTGFDPQQSRGQEVFHMIHPQDQAQQRQEFLDLKNGVKHETRSYTQLRKADGTFRAVEMFLTVLRDGDDRRIRYVGTFTDIEERRRAERALSEAEKKYRNIVEHAAGGIYQLTPEGLYLSANPSFAKVLGYDSPEQLLREVKNANEMLYISAAKREALYRDLEQRENVLNHETQMRRRDGSLIWVSESARLVKDENGQVLFIEGSIEDITQRKEADAAIREAKILSDMANRAKSEFLSNMSHELRTPLNSIIGFSEMIKGEIYGKLEQREYWEYARDINESGQKLLQVINEILDISKIEAGERQLSEGVVDIPDIVDSALDLLENKIKNNKMTITKSLDSAPQIVGEALALKQVILNLLSNAVKFTPEGGRITISAHISKSGRFHLSITDTGIGLDEAEIKKALSPFGQVNSALHRESSGTGLGLTLVDALVKLHGGEFELFSQKGIGTTATMILPADRIVKPKPKPNEIPDNKSEDEDVIS